MTDFNFGSLVGKHVGQNRDERASFVAVQHGHDNGPAVGPEHTSVIVHHDAGSFPCNCIDEAGCELPEERIVAWCSD